MERDHDQDGTVEMCTTNVWRLVESGGAVPEPRKNHSAVLVYSKLVIFGGVGVGEDDSPQNWATVSSPSARNWPPK